jgi:hypothetical protein
VEDTIDGDHRPLSAIRPPILRAIVIFLLSESSYESGYYNMMIVISQSSRVVNIRTMLGVAMA